nr:putative reverse transcriptase domain, aspartic peptidase domain protein [Tanacetum cinerariifolium]
FGDIHAPEFIYHGSLPRKSMQIISALYARTLLSHGCEGFLATIHDTTSDVPSIHDQPIVSEFPDVFPDELPRIPPVREVEFNIELIPGAEPISKAPYRMAPIELKELKDQLQELLERGFILLSFLVTIHDTTSDVPSIHDQPTVSEFPDVYPDELPGIPPVREVEFNIELIPGAEPISKAPYRMAPIELKELKDQLQELLDMAFLGHIVSAEGIMMDPAKVEAITKRPRSMCVTKHGYWASLRVEPDLISRVENIDKQVEFRLDDDNVLWQDTRLVVPNDASLREALLTEAHSSPFSIHPGSTKMYHDLKQHF